MVIFIMVIFIMIKDKASGYTVGPMETLIEDNGVVIE
jgi:hypothetical protein